MIPNAVLGVDPGKDGYSCFIYHGFEDIKTFALLSHAEKPFEVRHVWLQNKDIMFKIKAAVEKLGPRSGDSAYSVAHMMNDHGWWLGALAALDILDTHVYTKTWQYEFGLGGKQGPPGCSESKEYMARKNAHARAAEIIVDGQVEVTVKNADSILIAEYEWRKVKGTLNERRM